MKTKYLIFIALCIVSIQCKAQWYGQQVYEVDSVILTTAELTQNSPGYVMGGRRTLRQNSSSSPDFVIHKVDGNGQFSTPNEFTMEYQINSCGGTPHNCTGVRVVECKSPVPSNGTDQYYAIVVSSTAGIGFATLDQSGIPVQDLFWGFSPSSTGINNQRTPAIRESGTPNIFYLTSNYLHSTCVMKVDISTTPITVLFSEMYSNNNRLESRDIIESPAGNELIVVGRTDMAINPALNNWMADGFFMVLNSANGAVITHSVYNKQYDGDDWFTCIEHAQSGAGGNQGYILGGRSHYPIPFPTYTTSNLPYTQWVCKLDPAGTVLWSSLILPNVSNNQGIDQEITSVYERANPNSGGYEVYAAAGMGGCQWLGPCSAGKVVYKLDDNGQSVFTPDEFHYDNAWNNGGLVNVYSDVQLTAIETGGGPDDGIQVFGNSVTPDTSFLFTKAYFNGESGCADRTLTNIQQILQGPDSIRTEPINWAFFNFCNSNWLSPSAVNGNDAVLCYTASVSTGDNSRNSITVIKSETALTSEVIIYPNPGNGNVTVSLGSAKYISQLKVFDNLGKVILNLKPGSNQHEINIDLSRFEIETGIYYITIEADGQTSHSKLLYSK